MLWTKVIPTAALLLLAIHTSQGFVSNRSKESSDSQKEVAYINALNLLHKGIELTNGDDSKIRANVQVDWIEQKLDHFDEKETRTWQMRYLRNDELFKTGGPIFIYVGGEWEIEPSMISQGHFYDMAKDHNAMLFYTEHRYYGESKPTRDLSVQNLTYLHVKQALADLAEFIKYQRAHNSDLTNAKVIIAGGSYSATMVVWFKRLYPELLTGGWASSAPILAKVNFQEYFEIVGRSFLELGGQECHGRIQRGIADLESMTANHRFAEVKALLKICDNFDQNNDLDIYMLFQSIASVFASIAQYQRNGQLELNCMFLASYDNDAAAISGLVLALLLGDDNRCLDFSYKSTVALMQDISYVWGASRPWIYQTCNEYGWYQTSSSRNQPFGTKFPLTLSIAFCNDIYGNKYGNTTIHQLVEQTNKDFGGMHPSVENIYMTHGALDPWHPMGHGPADGAIVIPKTSHCQDFSSISSADSAEMVASKEGIADLVRKWLAE